MSLSKERHTTIALNPLTPLSPLRPHRASGGVRSPSVPGGGRRLSSGAAVFCLRPAAAPARVAAGRSPSDHRETGRGDGAERRAPAHRPVLVSRLERGRDG